MVLQSANCTECRSEVWHNDNFCQECGSRTSFVAKRDTQWRETPAAPSWNREPSEPTWTKSESSWNQSSEPTPIRSFVQSASAPQPVPTPEPTPPPPPAPLPAVVAVPVPNPVPVKAPVEVPVQVPTKVPTQVPTVENKTEEVRTPVEVPKAIEAPKAPEPKDLEEKREDVVLKSRWTALESPLLRPRMSDDVAATPPMEKVSNKSKITSILWLCVCFLAGILIYCLFDIVKMTVLKPASESSKQQPAAVVPAAPETKIESAPVPTPVPAEAPVEAEEAKSTVPVNTVSVDTPVSVKPVVVTPKPAVKPVVVPTKAQVPVVKPLPKPVVPVKLPAITKPHLSQPVVAPEVVKPRSSAEAENTSRTRTVWEAPANTVKAPQLPVKAVAPVSKVNRVVSTSKGSGGDLARYNRLLADYFSRAGNGSFGDESSEPPTYSEWLSRGKPEF